VFVNRKCREEYRVGLPAQNKKKKKTFSTQYSEFNMAHLFKKKRERD
jgi:hypothetical protein